MPRRASLNYSRFTGAGPSVTEALTAGQPPPLTMQDAMTFICDQASKQRTRLWIDAEQQVFQNTIDSWTIGLMKKYNKNGKALVYNTLQAYLKGTPANIERHLALAQAEGWTLGVKLVRGAYIKIETRNLIHDSIQDTHAAYDSIIQRLLTKTFPGPDSQKPYPDVQLMLASHNESSVKKGYETWLSRNVNGLPTIKLELAQLQGMADELSCGLVQTRKEMISGEKVSKEWYPRAFKCLCWGGTQECVQFLIRRAVENSGSLGRTHVWMEGLKKELWRRIKAPARARTQES
jgi:proline dehydrogenase